METTIFVVLGSALLIAVVSIIFIKRKITHSKQVALATIQNPDISEIDPPVSKIPDRITIGSNPYSPLVTLEIASRESSRESNFENAKSLDTTNNKSISRLSALCQAIPSLLVAGEASGKKLVEVVINGNLVRAADGNGLRAFAMNGKGITEQARLFEVGNLQHMINAAAIWQIASVVVAQKHLADISRKLDEIKEGVQHISQFLENQRKSRVLATYDYLEQVYLSIKGGDLPSSSRINLESCERDLLEIQHHLEIEYRQKIEKQVKRTEKISTKGITQDISKKISDLEELTGDIALCLKTRIAAWHVLSLFPGDPQLKTARQSNIQKSIDSFSDLALYFVKHLKRDVSAVDSLWKWGLDDRKQTLNNKYMTVVSSLVSATKQSSEYVIQSEHSLLEHDQPTHLYLQFENGELIDVRQAVQPEA